MSLLSDFNEFAQAFYALKDRLERSEKDFEKLETETAELRREVTALKATIDEREKTFEARMRAVVAETVAELRVRYAEEQAARSSQSLPPALPGPEG